MSKSEGDLKRLFEPKAGGDPERDLSGQPASLGEFSVQDVVSSTELRSTRNHEKSRQEFQQLLGPGFSGGPAGGGNDLINLQSDLTRQPLQPVAPLTGGLFDAGRPGADPWIGLGAGPAKGLDTVGAHPAIPTPASVTTSLQPIPEVPRMKPQPPILKFPERVR